MRRTTAGTSRINEHGQPIGPTVPGWSRRASPAPDRLEGRYATLVSLADADIEELWRAVAQPASIWTYLSQEPPSDPTALEAFLRSSPDWHTLVVRAPHPVGVLNYVNTATASGTTEIGAVVFGPALQRTRAATEALHLAAAHVFDDLGYRRLVWKCDSLNRPSRRAAVRLGFHYDGRFRKDVIYKGRSRDTDWFSITDEDWPGIRQAHQRWLVPDNFAPEGTQLTRLSELTRPPA